MERIISINLQKIKAVFAAFNLQEGFKIISQ